MFGLETPVQRRLFCSLTVSLSPPPPLGRSDRPRRMPKTARFFLRKIYSALLLLQPDVPFPLNILHKFVIMLAYRICRCNFYLNSTPNAHAMPKWKCLFEKISRKSGGGGALVNHSSSRWKDWLMWTNNICFILFFAALRFVCSQACQFTHVTGQSHWFSLAGYAFTP